jgi:hypothetical protein
VTDHATRSLYVRSLRGTNGVNSFRQLTQ